MSRVFTSVFNFQTTGVGNLLHARNVIKSLGGTSWIGFNQASRSMDAASRSFGKFAGILAGGAGMGYMLKNMIGVNAELQTNRILFEQMIGTGEEAGQMINMLQENAAALGYDLSEVMKSARGLYSGFSAGGRKVDVKDMQSLMEMAETLNALDTENRGISYAAFSLKEIAQGQGKLDFRSMTNRMEIPFQKATQDAITKALQAKDTKKALDLLWKGLEEAKVPRNLLNKLMEGGFLQNLNALKSYVQRIFLGIGNPIIDHMAHQMATLRKRLSEMFKPHSILSNSFELGGKLAVVSLKKLEGYIYDFFVWLGTTKAGKQFIINIMDAIDKTRDILRETLINIGVFFGAINIGSEKSQKDLGKLFNKILDRILEVTKKLRPFYAMMGKIVDLFIKMAESDLGSGILAFGVALRTIFGAPIIGKLLTPIAGTLIGAMLGGGAVGGGIAGAAGGGLLVGGLAGINSFLTILRKPIDLKGGLGSIATGQLAFQLGRIAIQARMLASLVFFSPMFWVGLGAVVIAYFMKTKTGQSVLNSLAESAIRAKKALSDLWTHMKGQETQEDFNKRVAKQTEAKVLSLRQKQLEGGKLSPQELAILHNNKQSIGKVDDKIKLQYAEQYRDQHMSWAQKHLMGPNASEYLVYRALKLPLNELIANVQNGYQLAKMQKGSGDSWKNPNHIPWQNTQNSKPANIQPAQVKHEMRNNVTNHFTITVQGDMNNPSTKIANELGDKLTQFFMAHGFYPPNSFTQGPAF